MGTESQLKKGLSIGIILFLAGASIASALNTNHSLNPKTDRGSWLYVGGSGPGNYTTIQSALDAANPGDTVFVYPGTYYENIRIQKTIDVIGQNRNTTIIDGNETGTVVNVTADLVNLSGFTIRNSGQHGNPGGIAVEASYCTIVDNVITNNSFGIIFGSLSRDEPQNVFAFNPRYQNGSSDSENNTVLHNIISNNRAGVFLYTDTPHNSIDGNTFLQNRFGVAIYPGSHHTILSNNTFLNDGLFILNQSYANTVVNNTVNGKPLLYLEGQSNNVITEAMGQIILVQCHNITVNKQEITNTSFGIELIDTTNCHISQNIIESNNFIGIFLYQSSDNILMNNTIRANSVQGIFIWGKNNMIADNTITLNTEDGLHLYHSINNTIVGNNISNNNHDGISIEVSESYNLISGNKIHQNKNCGMYFSSNRNNILLNNNITSNNNEGISADYCENILILNNTISHHNFGIQLSESNNNYLLENTITASNTNGIHLSMSSNHNIISGNNSVSNNTCGINIDSSDSNTLSNNNIINNKAIGIELYGSCNSIITENNISWNRTTPNNRNGIDLFYSNNNTINDNTIINATLGIEITDNSSYNSIRRNTISQSVFEAIRCSTSSSNTDISGNILKENGIGISLEDTNNNLIVDNIVSKNTIGINISGDTNTIKHNLISDNFEGITIYYLGRNTLISSNDLLNNTRNARFKELFRDRHNVWTKNYWDRPRVLPQPIFGRMSWRSFSVSIPWVTFDWHPATQPNHTSCFA